MSLRVVGLDVSKDNVVACLLTALPDEPRQFYLTGKFQRLYANATGIKILLDMEPHVAVLEPTGINYSRIWATKLAENGVKVVLVGHKQLRVFRSGLDLPDKDDDADSLALACYYLQYQKNPTRFVRQRDEVIALMRDRALRLHHLNRIQSPLINRTKQDLAWAFPERCKAGTNARLFWRWLGGNAKSARYDSELKNTCGYGLNDDIRFNANQIYLIHQRESVVEKELRDCLEDPRFTAYRRVFKRYGFGERTEAMLLSQLYPLENYLDGLKPVLITSRGREDPKKETVKKVSERKIKKSLGVAPEREWSGDGKASKKAGSRLCRTALWQWIFTRVEVKKGRLKNDRFTEIASYFDAHKASGIPIKLVRGRTAGFTVRRLFYDLVNELQAQDKE